MSWINKIVKDEVLNKMSEKRLLALFKSIRQKCIFLNSAYSNCEYWWDEEKHKEYLILLDYKNKIQRLLNNFNKNIK